MATRQAESEELPPLTPAVFHVLLALVDKERHGYAIMQEVTESTKGRIKMGPGTLYGTIKRLLEACMIEESDERPDPALDDERRKSLRCAVDSSAEAGRAAPHDDEIDLLPRGEFTADPERAQDLTGRGGV